MSWAWANRTPPPTSSNGVGLGNPLAACSVYRDVICFVHTVSNLCLFNWQRNVYLCNWRPYVRLAWHTCQIYDPFKIKLWLLLLLLLYTAKRVRYAVGVVGAIPASLPTSIWSKTDRQKNNSRQLHELSKTELSLTDDEVQRHWPTVGQDTSDDLKTNSSRVGSKTHKFNGPWIEQIQNRSRTRRWLILGRKTGLSNDGILSEESVGELPCVCAVVEHYQPDLEGNYLQGDKYKFMDHYWNKFVVTKQNQLSEDRGGSTCIHELCRRDVICEKK